MVSFHPIQNISRTHSRMAFTARFDLILLRRIENNFKQKGMNESEKNM
jgi:hypothetical protein